MAGCLHSRLTRVSCLITDLIITRSLIILCSIFTTDIMWLSRYLLYTSPPSFDICKHKVISWLTPGGIPKEINITVLEVHHLCIYQCTSKREVIDLPWLRESLEAISMGRVAMFVLWGSVVGSLVGSWDDRAWLKWQTDMSIIWSHQALPMKIELSCSMSFWRATTCCMYLFHFLSNFFLLVHSNPAFYVTSNT